LCGSGGWIRTIDLRVMSPTSCHCSTPRYVGARTYAPSGQPPVLSALRCFTTRFGMDRGGTTAPHARHWFRGQPPSQLLSFASRTITLPSAPLLSRFPPLHLFLEESPRPCARVTSTRRRASSARRFPGLLPGDLPTCSGEGTHLRAQFPLRCCQRFLLPDIATEPAVRTTTPPPAVRPRRSSRTKRSSLQSPKRP
jgi:hypothetical protein